MKYIFSIIFLLVFVKTASAQSLLLEGFIIDESGEGIPGITVTVKGTPSGTATDVEGKFELEGLAPKSHTLVLSGIGFQSKEHEVDLNTPAGKPLKITLRQSTTALDAVQVVGKSEVAEMREKPFAVTAIDVEPLKVQNLDINQILNTTTGVRIREEGGLGSNFNFSLNGFSGSQVKFFIDGIPMDYFGSSLTLNNIPANLISKIEVYKGVVPVHLGSDALGGAVNIITDQSVRNFLNVGYSFGSFNTHRASAVSKFTTANNFVVKANLFYNYSDNNYNIQAEVAEKSTGKVSEMEVERFHDAYESQTAQLELGVVNKPYADQLLIGAIASSNFKEIQQGYNLTKVIGAAHTTDKTIIPTFKYQKDDLLLKGLSANLSATYKYGLSHRIDTSSRKYNWLGEYEDETLGTSSGEISWYKTKFRFTDHATTASANVTFEINDNHSFSVNNLYSYFRRVGGDPISPDSEEVPFSKPNILRKNITGVSYSTNLLKDKLRTVLFAKYFHLRTDGYSESELGDGQLTKVQKIRESYGYGFAATYFFTPSLQVKASLESTYRLPEASEFFGNGLQVLSNTELEPEESKNFNLGVLSQNTWSKHQLSLEGSFIYREPKNMIFQKALGNTSEFQNLKDTRATGFEGDARYDFNRRVNLSVNATYQYIVNDQKYDPVTGGVNYLYKAQVPNLPFFYGNATAGIIFPEFGGAGNKLMFNWKSAFVEAFYLKWPVNGARDTKKDIPRQFSHGVSLSYMVQDGRYNVSVACTNLFDAMLFDNFMLQKPGRAFNIKLSYFLK